MTDQQRPTRPGKFSPRTGTPRRRNAAGPTPEADAGEQTRLQKVLAEAGMGSRRELEVWIAAGRVQVNGQVATLGQRVGPTDRIRVDGQDLRRRPAQATRLQVIAYNKPEGEIVTRKDPEERPTIFRHLPRPKSGRWISVGRLDVNTSGLLLVTNDGELANRLMHPSREVEREYAVRILGAVPEPTLARLIDGVNLDDGPARFESIAEAGGEGANHWYRVVITEGRNREVRRMFEALGMAVSRLIRIRYGCVVLPRGLRRGVWVDLPAGDLQTLQSMVGGQRAPQSGQQQQQQGNGRPNNRNKRNRGRDNRGPREGGQPAQQQPQLQQEPRRHDDDSDNLDFASIPNPLQQTFDRRAIREARQPKREISEDGPIPNPLEQTYDKRGVQKPRGLGVGGGGGGGRKGGKGAGGGERQPDPMQTSVGYIGADAFHKQMSGGGGGGGGGGRGGRRRR
jgi:23S rRNA pseudouridine2605 synthase